MSVANATPPGTVLVAAVVSAECPIQSPPEFVFDHFRRRAFLKFPATDWVQVLMRVTVLGQNHGHRDIMIESESDRDCDGLGPRLSRVTLTAPVMVTIMVQVTVTA